MSHPMWYSNNTMETQHQHIDIAYILDRSGSMGHLTESAITSFNDFLKDQKSEAGEVTFTLVLFDNEYLLHADAVPIREVVELDTTTYVPRASTALNDAIGRTIDTMGKRLAAMKEEDRPSKVVIAIFTDGMENASTDYTESQISAMIKHQQDKYSWEFLFLAANQDAIVTARRMNIRAGNASSVLNSQLGMNSSSTAMSRKMKAIRLMESGISSKDLLSSLSAMVSEEETKQKSSSDTK